MCCSLLLCFYCNRLGPPGTAICVYHNDVIDNPTQYNQGLYSVFLEDVTRAPGLSPSMIQNEYFAVSDSFKVRFLYSNYYGWG